MLVLSMAHTDILIVKYHSSEAVRQYNVIHGLVML